MAKCNLTKHKKGLLIVIDGTDGSGKETQSNILYNKLTALGIAVLGIGFPRYGQKSAAMVADYLNGKFGTAEEVGPYKASILYAVDRFAASNQIKKWLQTGKVVLSNRYTTANMGHQAGKIKDRKKRDEFLKWIEDLEYNKLGIPRPDKNILLYIQPKIGQGLVDKKGEREYLAGKKRDIHEADLKHLQAAARAFLYVAKKYHWDIINCAPKGQLRTPEDIAAEIWQVVKPIVM
ncbi:MAG: thymidylate kinase [Patescibacteria group bacterium]|nr:thymidylate kinase [Patescibacteria group bacterium]